MSPEIKKKWDEHLYQMEKCSFLLDVIRAHISVIMTTDAHSGSMLDACVILGGVSPQYCDFILKMRERFPDHDLEMLSQEIYDRIFSRDFKSTAKFQAFFETPLEQWYIVRKKARDLRDGLLDKDEAIAEFKHAYFMQFETDVDVTEIVGDTKSKPEQQDAGLDSEMDYEDDEAHTKEMIIHIQRKEAQDELICQMFREGAISEDVAIKYVGGDLEYNSFMKLVSIYTDEKKETETEEEPFDYFGYYKQETEAKLLCKMYREGIISEEIALEYIDEPNFTHEDFLRIVDIFAE